MTVEVGRGAAFGGVVGEVEAIFGMDASERHRKRLALERRIEATKSLVGRVTAGRNRVNGSEARALESMRQTMMARW